MDHVARPLHILLAEKEGRNWFNIKCLKLYQFEIITWWCLSILECILKFILHCVLKFVPLKKKTRSLGIGVRPTSWRWKLWETMKPLIHSPPRRTPCRLLIHGIFFGPLGLHLHVWRELGRSPPFRPMRALRLHWSRAFSLVWEVALHMILWTANTQMHSYCLWWPDFSIWQVLTYSEQQ
jgi:hypothetical protein